MLAAGFVYLAGVSVAVAQPSLQDLLTRYSNDRSALVNNYNTINGSDIPALDSAIAFLRYDAYVDPNFQWAQDDWVDYATALHNLNNHADQCYNALFDLTDACYTIVNLYGSENLPANVVSDASDHDNKLNQIKDWYSVTGDDDVADQMYDVINAPWDLSTMAWDVFAMDADAEDVYEDIGDACTESWQFIVWLNTL
jgi:hypothetical protein